MTPDKRKAMRDRWCTGDCDIRMTYVQAGTDIGVCLDALEEAETLIAVYCGELADYVEAVRTLRKWVFEKDKRIAELEGELLRSPGGIAAELPGEDMP